MTANQCLEGMSNCRLTMTERLRHGEFYRKNFAPDLSADCEIDLHCHSFFSDGYDSPTFRVCEAYRRRMSGLAVVDHDNFDGCMESISAGEIFGVTVVPGAEFCTSRSGIEILAFFPDIADFKRKFDAGVFDAVVEPIRRAKAVQLKRMIAKVPAVFAGLKLENAEINTADIEKYIRNGLSAKGDISVILQEKYGERLKALGVCSNVKDLHAVITTNPNRLGCDLELELDIKPEALIRCILDWGGVPVLAHPTELINKEHLDNHAVFETLKNLRNAGLQGVEVDGFRNRICPETHRHQTWVFEEFRRQLNLDTDFPPLLATNGGDTHNQPNEAGLELGCGLNHNLLPEFGRFACIENLRRRQSELAFIRNQKY